MAVVGPGAAPQQVSDPLPLLDRASDMEYVILLNPLTDDFAVRVAQDLPVNMPVDIRAGTGLVQTENDVVRNYGFGLKGKDFQAKKHVQMDTIIKAGQTKVFKGNEAQVAIRQLTYEILQREGNKRLLADPTLRNEVESRIIKGRGPIQDLMDGTFRTPRSQIDEAINKSNEVQDEPAFPGLTNPVGQPPETGEDGGADASTPERRTPGSPKRAK